jgi:hypothetical protein
MPDWLLAFFNWLQGLSGGAPSFVGSFTGAAIGLIALLLGALFNAHLNRRRDDRIRNEEARTSAIALKAELSGIVLALSRNVEDASNKQLQPNEGYTVPDLSQAVRVLPHVLPKLGLLDTDTIQAVLDAYALVEQHCEALIMIGAKPDPRGPFGRRRLFVPGSSVDSLTKIDRATSEQIQEAVAKLDTFLKRPI